MDLKTLKIMQVLEKTFEGTKAKNIKKDQIIGLKVRGMLKKYMFKIYIDGDKVKVEIDEKIEKTAKEKLKQQLKPILKEFFKSNNITFTE